MSLHLIFHIAAPLHMKRREKITNVSDNGRSRKIHAILENPSPATGSNRRRRRSCRSCLLSRTGMEVNVNGDAIRDKQKHVRPYSNSTEYQLGARLGMIPFPPLFSSSPINRSASAWLVFFMLVGFVAEKLWSNSNDNPSAVTVPATPTSPILVDNDFHRKESVEWVNMIIGKLWKFYNSGNDDRLIDLVQPVMDDLVQPGYIRRVVVHELSLGDDPFSVRTVDRRTSRSVDDLQYHVGLRYAGGASILLSVSLRLGIISVSVPIVVRNFDIDGEVWVKMRLLNSEPWIELISWAFVSVPTIKFELSPFSLFNLMALPVFSGFLNKFLAEDLPEHFVLPNRVTVDSKEDRNSSGRELRGGNDDHVGELSVTLVRARKLSRPFFADPFVILSVGDRIVRSKRNSQTTVTAPPDKPIWNQDFHMPVSDQENERLLVELKDTVGFAEVTVGVSEIGLRKLDDTVPTDMVVELRRNSEPFGNTITGELLLRLTYKAYVDGGGAMNTARKDEMKMLKTTASVSTVDVAPARTSRERRHRERSRTFFRAPSPWFWVGVIGGVFAVASLTIAVSSYLNNS